MTIIRNSRENVSFFDRIHGDTSTYNMAPCSHICQPYSAPEPTPCGHICVMYCKGK